MKIRYRFHNFYKNEYEVQSCLLNRQQLKYYKLVLILPRKTHLQISYVQEKQRVGEARTVLPFWWNFEITATEGIRSVGGETWSRILWNGGGGRVLGFRKISRSPPNGASNAKFVENSAKGISNWGCCGFRGKRTHVRVRMEREARW